MTVTHADLVPHAHRFWSRVEIGADEAACWDWTRGLTGRGYGQFAVPFGSGYKTVGAHRAAWMLHNRQEIPAGAVLDHRCGRPICCNPHHLAPTSNGANVAAGKGGRSPERLHSGRYKVRFRATRSGRTIETSRTFAALSDAEAFARTLTTAYDIPARVRA